MIGQEASKVGKRGIVVIPSKLRKKFRLEEGSYVIAEAHAEGILLRPAAVLPVEIYSAERKAELILGNATNAKEYRKALVEVRTMGLDPAKIDHFKPPNS